MAARTKGKPKQSDTARPAARTAARRTAAPAKKTTVTPAKSKAQKATAAQSKSVQGKSARTKSARSKAVKSGKTAHAKSSATATIGSVREENARLRAELDQANARIRHLEELNRNAANRIDWVIDSLQSVLKH